MTSSPRRTHPASFLLSRLSRINLWHFLWIAVALSVLMSLPMSYLIHGRLAWDYPLTAACISAVVASLVLFLIKQIRSEQQRTEEALRESEARLRAIIGSEPECVKVVAPDGTLLEMNPAGLSMVEADSPEAVIGRPVIRLVHPEDRPAFQALHDSVMQGRPGTLQFRIIGLRGTLRSLETQAAPLRDGAGRIASVLSITRDVTERKRAEDALKESERKLGEAQRIAHLGYWERDLASDLLTWSDETYRIFGLRPHERLLHFAQFQEFIHPEDRGIIIRAVTEALRGGPGPDVEYRVVRPDGEIRVVHSRGHVMRDESGQPRRIFGTIQDITERKRAEASLHAKTSQLQLISETMTAFYENGDWREASTRLLRGALRLTESEYGFIGVVMEGPVLRVLAHEGIVWNAAVNREFYERAMRTYEEKGYLEFTNLENLFGRIITTGTVVIANEPGTDPRSGGLPPGHPPLRHFLGVPILRGSEVVGMIGVANRPGGYTGAEQAAIEILTQAIGVLYDSYLRRERQAELEEELRQSQKMEAIGRLAGGLAHDFNNLLMVIQGYGELLREQFGQDRTVATNLGQIRQAAESAGLLVRQLLAFSRKQVLDPRVLDLNAVIGGIGGMIRRLLGEDIDLAVSLAPNLGAVKADQGQVEQVLMNLAANARDAMPQGGRVTIETTNIEMTEPQRRGQVVVPGPYVMLAVSDTGVGMDAATQARIFEPFFTTKTQGKGTGLGLSSVYGIVKQSGGYIFVYSEPGRGTTFKIYLPRVNEEVSPIHEKPSVRVIPRGTETILLVEDEPAIRELVSTELAALGYTVLAARHGFEALLVSNSHEGPIHLLLADVVMPQMSGPELAERLTSSRPDLRVLYMSGYGSESIVHHGIIDPGTAFLQKPFTQETLASKVRAVLDQPGS
ncbi:MAG: PAS domain-containing protein [Nitrospirota bacterium]